MAGAPLWLKGFEGATSNESIGSLIVNVDGRNEPLTVGEHKVTIDIRDQIARTTIEETFVNRTKSRLEEAVPFPAAAGRVDQRLRDVDRRSARRGGHRREAAGTEIFETILRENRDPGLLEWAGGNIFKARVFPIEPLSEKRIKITYTQVLLLRANRYRYSYGLRSELLQKFPAAGAVGPGERPLGPAAQERYVPHLCVPIAGDAPFGPARFHGEGVHAAHGTSTSSAKSTGRTRRSSRFRTGGETTAT